MSVLHVLRSSLWALTVAVWLRLICPKKTDKVKVKFSRRRVITQKTTDYINIRRKPEIKVKDEVLPRTGHEGPEGE
jgi:hypothetical protein